MRDPGGRGAWIKQASWGLEEVTPALVHLVSPDGEVLDGGGPRHSEYPIHTEIMLARPDVGGVVHVHSRHAVALGASGQPLRPVSHEANYFVPPQVPRFTQTTDLILTRELGAAVARVLGRSAALFLVNHGIVCAGPDLETATVAAILLERACQQQILAQSLGGGYQWTPEDESLAKREHIYHPGAIRQAWDYLARGLPGGSS
ncbi:MAG TPA: class II aldolase/adducin family protein [Streptosporangiaceae bacterium]|nr:class II aldolase/adducin family protein [Streptosporangiaceae bacterium]